MFDLSTGAKQACLKVLRDLISDGGTRYLVLEVRRAEDVAAILHDLAKAGMLLESPL